MYVQVKCMRSAGRSGGWTWPSKPDDLYWYTEVQGIQPPSVSQRLSSKRRTVFTFTDV